MHWGPESVVWPTRRSRAFDVALALTVALADGALLWFVTDFYVPGPLLGVASFLMGASLVVRRRYPATIAATITGVSTALGAGFLSYIVGYYTLGAYAVSRRAVAIIATLGVAGFMIQPGPTADRDTAVGVLLLIGTVVVAAPVLLGLYMGTRKQLIASLQERTRRLEREQTLLAERARVEERTRIAREMHDVVANRVSVMVVHSGALKAIATRDPLKAAETAGVIGEMGRQALDELRQVIGVLRLGEETGPLATPTLEDFRELVAQSGAAGLRVCLTTEFEDGTLPPAVARTVYRVIQEALTNVHKHAGDADTEVVLRQLPELVEMTVVNAPEAARADHGLPSGGNGLLGLRERVTALGGTFEAGPRQEGGFAVSARIPLPTVRPAE